MTAFSYSTENLNVMFNRGRNFTESETGRPKGGSTDQVDAVHFMV